MFERCIETTAGIIHLEWDDMSDPKNSVGWVASLECDPGDEQWQPVGSNVAEEWARINALEGSEQRWSAFRELVERTYPEAADEARRIFGGKAN